MRKKILLTGASGLLGTCLLQTLEHEYDIEVFQGDISDASVVNFYLRKNIQYEWVIHAAAMTDVTLCESERDKCFSSNVLGTKNIRDVAQACNSRFLYISTVSVFSGVEGNYKETDIPYPKNFYNLSKYLGEVLTQEYPKGIILRTNIIGVHPHGSRGTNFIEWMLDAIRSNRDLQLFNDVMINPLSSWTLADVSAAILKSPIENGTFHVGSINTLSKAEIGQFVINSQKDYTGNVKLVSVDEVLKDTMRPKNMTLQCSLIEQRINVSMPTLESELEKLLSRLEA